MRLLYGYDVVEEICRRPRFFAITLTPTAYASMKRKERREENTLNIQPLESHTRPLATVSGYAGFFASR